MEAALKLCKEKDEEIAAEIATLKIEAQELHDKYGKLWDENAALKSLVGDVIDIVVIYPAETHAQKEWRDNWLAKAREVLK